MKHISKVLCPIDFSEPSKAALASAVYLAERYSAELILFHAISQIDPAPTPTYTLTNDYLDQVDQLMKMMMENAQKAMKMKDLIAQHVDNRVPAREIVETGVPADSIIAAARREKADVIVISTHGRSGIKGIFFGSIAEKIRGQANNA